MDLTTFHSVCSPGSATQVTVGVLVAFGMLLLFQRYRPYAAPGMTFVASVAQVNLFMVLFVGEWMPRRRLLLALTDALCCP